MTLPLIKIKSGVTILGLAPQMILALLVAYVCYANAAAPEFVLTSGNDGAHSIHSKHYVGNAADIRTNNLPSPRQDGPRLAEEIKECLGRDYDVLFEGDHIHIEYDPRRPL